MAARFIPVQRDTDYLLPPSVQDWLPDSHLARFVVEVVTQLDLSALEAGYAGRGSAAHHPSVLPAGSDFVQGYNAQAAVDTESMMILAHGCVQAANDKQQVEPMLAPLQALAQRLGQNSDTGITLAADTGYYSQANVDACERAGITPLIAQKREAHSGWLDRRLASAPVMPENATAVDRMRHRLPTPAGRAAYALRKCTVEPVFGIIKQVMRFRQFLVRGLNNVQGEWGLVCLAFNIKRLAVLRG